MSLKKITTRFAIFIFLFTAMACVQEEEAVYDLNELEVSAVEKCTVGWPPPTPQEVEACRKRNREEKD